VSALRERTQELTAEYWQTRETLPERVCVAQLILAFARIDLALQAATTGEDAHPEIGTGS
jgi:hypothetical protein